MFVIAMSDDNLVVDQSANDLTELIQRISDRLDRTVTQIAQINQSVDERLQSGLLEIQQSLENQQEPLQRQRSSGKGKEKASSTPTNSRSRSWADRVSEASCSRSWADRMSEDEAEDGEIDKEIDEPVTKKTKLEVSEHTKELVRESFLKPLSTTSRRETRGRAPTLDLAETRCPRLDPLFKTQESKFTGNSEAKQVDNDLQKIQALILDVAAPLLELKGCTEKEDNPRSPAEAVDDAIRLLGNAVAATSKMRRKRILKVCNKMTSCLRTQPPTYLVQTSRRR